MKILLILLVSFHLQVLHVSSHGRFTKPASRASAYKFGYNTPPNYDDHGMGCKTISNCGICGDKPPSKKTQAPGRFATGTITGRYTAGRTIKVTTQLTTNHQPGTMDFKLCVNNDFKRDKGQSCFERNVLKLPNGNTVWTVPPGNGNKYIDLVLPAGVSCKQCILQWNWYPKNYGNEAIFRACSDISISGGRNPTDPKPKTCPKTHPYAYRNGKWCCHTRKDENGQRLSRTSKSCQHSEYRQCPGPKCTNYPKVPPVPPPCKDKKQHCDYWKGQGFCTEFHVEFMKTYCKKSCNACDD